jgi:hypothetical protein
MGLMTRSEVIAELVAGAILAVSALSACGQESARVTEGTLPRIRAVPASSAPRTPEQMPPEPPKVTCNGGRLTISAQNSTLGSVLDAVHACTGAEIVVPAGAAAERLFAELGPGPVRTVLTDLLSSTDFNYAIQASPSDQQTVQTVLLSRRASDSQTELASNGNVPPNWREWLESQQYRSQPVSSAKDESGDRLDASPHAPVETASAAASTNPVGETVVDPAPVRFAAIQTVASEIALAPIQSNTPKSQDDIRQQLIADMLRLFDQRKQMHQQQATLTIEEPEFLVTPLNRVQD